MVKYFFVFRGLYLFVVYIRKFLNKVNVYFIFQTKFKEKDIFSIRVNLIQFFFLVVIQEEILVFISGGVSVV